MILQIGKGMSQGKGNSVNVYLTLLFTQEDDIFTEADLQTLETFIAQRLTITARKTAEGSEIRIDGTTTKPNLVNGIPIGWSKIYNTWEITNQAQLMDEIQKWLIAKQ